MAILQTSTVLKLNMQISLIEIQGSQKHETHEEQALKTLACKAD